MTLPRVRFTLRRLLITAAICVATFGGFTHRVMSQRIDILPGEAAAENFKVGDAASKTIAFESLVDRVELAALHAGRDTPRRNG